MGQGVPDAERQDRVQGLLNVIGLSNFADACLKELSGGMKQRVGFARALSVDLPAVSHRRQRSRLRRRGCRTPRDAGQPPVLG
nr:ATP-binding cassette domain-containing protein [Haloarcula sebkhae]